MTNNLDIADSKRATIVVIDDEELSRFSLRKKLSRFGYNVITLDKAEDALYLLKHDKQQVDFIITDILLRKMDGIELLRHINILDDPIPVLLTGQGNVEDAIKALHYGACDFIRKPIDVNEVASIIRNVLKQKNEKKQAIAMGKYIAYEKREFLLPADSDLGNVVSFQLSIHLPGIGLCNQVTAENISLALREAINNAMFHGNLEVSSDIREKEGIKAYHQKIEERNQLEKYNKRRVKIQYELTPDYVEYIIEDEGPGFDYTALPDPRDPENFFNKSGRGILIIKIHMDEVEWNKKGNRLRIKKYRIK
jgi:FixJ family two-component response regulator/anti-sigma regulatory factor (Ser/Thr protein kinase)